MNARIKSNLRWFYMLRWRCTISNETVGCDTIFVIMRAVYYSYAIWIRFPFNDTRTHFDECALIFAMQICARGDLWTIFSQNVKIQSKCLQLWVLCRFNVIEMPKWDIKNMFKKIIQKIDYHLDEFCSGQSHNHLKKKIEKANKKNNTWGYMD